MNRGGGKTEACRVLACGTTVRWPQVLCSGHWLALPSDMRAAIIAAGADKLARARASGSALLWYGDPANRDKAQLRISGAESKPASLPYRED